MAGGYAWSRRVGARVRTLRGLVADTQRALKDVVDILSIEPEVHESVQAVGEASLRSTALVILGSTSSARARLVASLLGHQLLPEDMPRGCRWIRIGYGSSTQVHLSLGNSEFELVGELESARRPWDVLPVEDLIRQDTIDLTTILEVEINNQFLKDGIRIIIPPDIATEPGDHNYLQLKNMHSDFYQKRASILKNFNCVYLYAIDKTGKNIFSDNIRSGLALPKNDLDIWKSFNLYTGNVRSESVDTSDGDGSGDKIDDERVVWAGREAVLSSENCLDLHQMKDIAASTQPLFVLFADAREAPSRGPPPPEATESARHAHSASDELPEADKAAFRDTRSTSESPEPKPEWPRGQQQVQQDQVSFMHELLDQWELMTNPPQKHYIKSQWAILDDAELMRSVDIKHASTHGATDPSCRGKWDDRVLRNRGALLSLVMKFAADAMHSYLLDYASRLGKVHMGLLQRFVAASFSLARELQVVPKRVQYVASHEQTLYETIHKKFADGEKKQELLQMMQDVLQEIKTDINNMDWRVDDLPCHRDQRFAISSSSWSSVRGSGASPTPSSTLAPAPSSPRGPPAAEAPSDGEEADSYDSYNIEEYDIIQDSYSDCYNHTSKLEDDSIALPSTSILVENESEMFSLSNTWATLPFRASSSTAACCAGHVSLKHATLDVQQTVLAGLSHKISLKLVKFFDCLKESYFGTLQRCLESLESSCRAELGGAPASEAVRQLLSAGRRVALQPADAFSVLDSLLHTIRRLLTKLSVSSGEGACALSAGWRRRAALATARSLSASRLARVIATQILDRLSEAHERYQAALGALEAALAARLHHTEHVKLAIRKKYAPLFAKLCLESTSMCDLLMYGTPELGREIGRGQYGVVFAARAWAGHAPVAVKSVLPGDERQYHELAMEFAYARSLPPHPRLVPLLGAVVTRSGGRGVLLVAERRVRDLHAAVRAGLAPVARMRVAADVVEGIRFLHSQGLVHRDVKLKNVLLDARDRAALADLGFCAAGALMSGSVVGSPVHMAPELLTGNYGGAVDVYAFGILFWYLCAGDVRLPAAFEAFSNKEQLWTKVKKGLRPERLPQFTDECWAVMESCWAADPAQRPLLGDVQHQLQAILDHTIAAENSSHLHYNTDEDCLNMTGLDGNDV